MSHTPASTLSRRSLVWERRGPLQGERVMPPGVAPQPMTSHLSHFRTARAAGRIPLVGPPHGDTDVWC